QIPLAKRPQIAGRVEREHRFAQIKQINPAAELARARLGFSMRALGDHAAKAVLAAEEQENLRSLAVLDLSQADTAIGNQRHGLIIRQSGGGLVSLQGCAEGRSASRG